MTTGLTHESNEARQELAAVLNEPGETAFRDADKARVHFNKAFDLLLFDQEVVDVDNNAMLMHCEMAIATIDHEHALEVMAVAHEEEALRRGSPVPEHVCAYETAENRSDDWLFRPSRAGRESEVEREADDGSRER